MIVLSYCTICPENAAYRNFIALYQKACVYNGYHPTRQYTSLCIQLLLVCPLIFTTANNV